MLWTCTVYHCAPCLFMQAKVADAEKTEKEIDITRSKYIPVATRTQLLFFCTTDLSNIDPMYQYSLEWYISIFLNSIASAEKSGVLRISCSLPPPPIPPLSLPPLSPLLLSSLSLILSKSNSSTLGLCFTYIIHMQMILRSVFSTSMTISPSASTAMSVGHSLRSTNCCSLSSSVSAYSWMTTKSTW